MINVRCNFKNKYEDLMYPRCKKEIDDEKHLPYSYSFSRVLMFVLSRKKIHLPAKISTEFTLKKTMSEI